MDTEHHSTQHDGCHQAGGKDQELFAQTHKIDLLFLGLILAQLGSTIQPGVAQSFDGGRTADHDAGGKHAKHEVEQHAGQQRIAKSVNGTGGGGAKGKEHKVQCLGKQAVRGAEGTHQHDGHDDDGHVAVDDGGQAAGKAALQCAVQGLAILQLFLDALGRDDVGVHAHANGQNDTGDAGQRQGKALKHWEVAGNKGQRGGHLTGQCNAGQKARQTVQHRHEHHDQCKGDDTGQHHGAQAVLAQAGADGGVAVHLEGKGQCAGVDLAGHLDHGILREGVGSRTGDDGLAIGDGRIDGGRAHILVIQPDADGAVGSSQTGGGLTKGLGTLVGELQGHIVLRSTAAGHRAVLGRSTFNHGAVQDQVTVGAAALAEGQIGRGADLLNGRFRVEVCFAGLPRELQDQAVRAGVHIQLVVGHIQCDQTVLDDELRRFQLLFGGIVVLRGHKGDVDAAFDVHTEPDVLCTLDVGGGHIAVLCRHAEKRRVHKRKDQKHCDDQVPCFAFCLHMFQEYLQTSRLLRDPLLKPPPAGPADRTEEVFTKNCYACSASSFSTTARRTQTHSSSEAVSTSSRLG